MDVFFFLIIKPTRCTNFSNLFLEWNSTCFGQFLCLSSGVFHCTHGNDICHTGLLTACEQDQDGTHFHPDDGQRNCPKHVEFNSKNKFEKLVHLAGIIIRNLTRRTVTWTSDYGRVWNICFIFCINAWEVCLNSILFGGKMCWIQAVKLPYWHLKYV